MRRTLLLTAVAFALLASAAVAAEPTRTRIVDFTATSVLADLCAFPVTVTGTSNGTFTDFFDNSGALVRSHIQNSEQDTFTANGKTLVSMPYAFSVEIYYDSAGNVVSATGAGLIEHIRLPDGSTFVSVGRVTVTGGEEPAILAPDVGHTGDFDALCAALSA
jgi:hypothetical protein